LITGTLVIDVALIATCKVCFMPFSVHSMCGMAMTWFGYLE